jgi:4-hydroxybenzoyl-CoA thioesterase
MTKDSYLLNRIPLFIEWGHCDPAGIVWNQRFFEFFDAGTWALFEIALNIKRERLLEHYGIFGFPLVSAGATFTSPLRFGDRASLETKVVQFNDSSFNLSHRVIKDNIVAVDGVETRVWTIRDGRNPDRLRAASVPDDVVASFRT